jgi:D-alanyl-D-alanine carboxypeptidase
MTATARRLGMSGTTFRNANGLPDEEQVTTAHDMALLGIALREHFPQYYGYFSTRSFVYRGHRIANHNHLLGHVAGVDGIKTGYTRASGFNLVTSVKLDGRSIVAVVLGGRSARARDAQMVRLIHKYLPEASRRGDGGDLVASRATVGAASVAVALPRRDPPTPDKRPAQIAAAPEPQPLALVENTATPAAKAVAAATARPARIDPVETASTSGSGGGWVIQVASAPSEEAARAVLDHTSKEAHSLLADASPFTATYVKNGTTYYRARYSGFESKSDAWNACGALKRKKIACYAIAR